MPDTPKSELAALCDELEAIHLESGPPEDGECLRCHRTMFRSPGLDDPTQLCHDCAHWVVDQVPKLLAAARRAEEAERELAEAWRSIPPHDMVLRCPKCGLRHLDIGEFETRVHRKHLCENTTEGPGTGCGHLWTPFPYATRGVRDFVTVGSERYQALEAGRDQNARAAAVIREHGELIAYGLCLATSVPGLENEERRREAFAAVEALGKVRSK